MSCAIRCAIGLFVVPRRIAIAPGHSLGEGARVEFLEQRNPVAFASPSTCKLCRSVSQ